MVFGGVLHGRYCFLFDSNCLLQTVVSAGTTRQDVVGYQKLLRFYMRDVEIGANLGTSVIARGTPGFFGADLTNLMNEVDLMAACGRRKFVGMAEFEAAKDKMLMGTERQ